MTAPSRAPDSAGVSQLPHESESHPNEWGNSHGAEGRVPAPRVRRFYRRTLPQLGWERTARDTYAREGEVLELDYFAGDGPLTVRYTLRPE